MPTRDVAIVSRRKMMDYYVYEVIDDTLRKHVVEISDRLLTVSPKGFTRVSDEQHLDTLAVGAVLMSLTRDATFHRVDPEMVDRAYQAAGALQRFDRFDTDKS
jgi:uncharacterized protein (DUF2461 family)